MTSGNFWSRIADDRAAARAYLLALEGERLVERRALIFFNLAKLSYARQDLMTTFAYLSEARPDNLASTKLKDALLLLKTRVFLGIGQYDKARTCLTQTRARGMGSPTTNLERTYLGFILRALSETWRSSTRLEDMEKWAQKITSLEIGDYYKAELLVVRRFAFAKSIVNVSRTRGRLIHHAKKARAGEFIKLWDLAGEIYSSKNRPVSTSNINAFHDFGHGQHNLLFNALSFFALKGLIKRRQFVTAEKIASSLDFHIRRQLATFHATKWRQVLGTENQGLNLIEKLKEQMPVVKSDNRDDIKNWLST